MNNTNPTSKNRSIGMETPWPLIDVLAKLIEATEHLLTVHDCDTHGHEEYRTAAAYGVAHLEALRTPDHDSHLTDAEVRDCSICTPIRVAHETTAPLCNCGEFCAYGLHGAPADGARCRRSVAGLQTRPGVETAVPRVFHFDRYRDGKLMAEGATVRKQATEAEALAWVRSRYPPGDTFVLRSEKAAACRHCASGSPRTADGFHQIPSGNYQVCTAPQVNGTKEP